MDGFKNLYVVLAVSEKATFSEIKKAYRALAKIRHPDKGGSEELFQELNDANEILKEPETRAQYDEQLRQMRLQFGNEYSSVLKEKKRREQERKEQERKKNDFERNWINTESFVVSTKDFLIRIPLVGFILGFLMSYIIHC